MMKEALKVIEAWGFTYKSIAFQWVKQNRSGKGYFFGLGRWTRGNTEPCLLAVKGKPKRISASVGQLVFSPLRRHSQKPDEVRDRIVELMGDLPRIELFARETAPGWDSWGNEVPHKNIGKEETDGQNNKTVGRRKATRSDATEAVWARAQPAADADKIAAVPADNPAEGPKQMTLLGPGA